MNKVFLSIISVVIFISCQSKVANLDGLDSQKFKKDVGNCREYRLSVLDTIVSQKSKIYQMREVNLKKILGRADEMNLNQRSTKVFLYRTLLSQPCDSTKVYSALAVELDALGRVGLVYLLPN